MPFYADTDKNREIYDHADDEIWRRAVYEPAHDGWHFANIGGRRFLESVGTAARLGPDSQVLDLCCGSGATACYMAERFGSAVTGLDINASQIERARLRAQDARRLAFLQADVCAWQPDRRYDLVVTMDSVTLIADVAGLFATCRAALGPGGRLAVAEVVAGAGLSKEMRDFALAEDGVVSLNTADRLGAQIEAAGFKEIEIVSLADEAVRVFTIIHRSVRQSRNWHDIPPARIEDWKNLTERYLAAYVSGELGYVQIFATAL